MKNLKNKAMKTIYFNSFFAWLQVWGQSLGRFSRRCAGKIMKNMLILGSILLSLIMGMGLLSTVSLSAQPIEFSLGLANANTQQGLIARTYDGGYVLKRKY
ncbi:MAG: hypothetical protein HC880_08215 [Bacteroidia bacterium]|nr:hypothetical protein [Bacteroidia bacterium]